MESAEEWRRKFSDTQTGQRRARANGVPRFSRHVLFSLAFFLVGVGATVGAFLIEEQAVWLLAIFGLLFLAGGSGVLYVGATPAVFDKRKGFFWKGRKEPDAGSDWRHLKHCARLGEIHALQLITEQIKGKSSYSSYELNLVLNDGRRINVVDHGGKDRIRADAAALAKFLNKPLWDAVEKKILSVAQLDKAIADIETIQASCPQVLGDELNKVLAQLKKKKAGQKQR